MLVQEGVATKIEPTGKVFPVSDRAFDVQQVLVRRLQRSSCAVRFGCPVHQLSQHEGLFELRGENLAAFLASGLCSPPAGAPIPVAELPAKVTPGGNSWGTLWCHPVLCTRASCLFRSMAAFALRYYIARCDSSSRGEAELPAATDPMGRFHAARHRAVTMGRGSLLFTHFGLSGPVVLDVSRAVTA